MTTSYYHRVYFSISPLIELLIVILEFTPILIEYVPSHGEFYLGDFKIPQMVYVRVAQWAFEIME